MTTCTDIYTLAAPPACGDIWAFPSVLHPPTPTPSGGMKGGMRYYDPDYQATETFEKPKRRPHNDDDEIALLIGLGYL